MSGFDDDLKGEVGREAWYVLRGRWLGVSSEVVAQEPASFERQGQLAEALRELRAPGRDRVAELQDLPADERESIKDVLDATQRPFPLLRRPVPLPQAVQCAEELWAEVAASESRASASKLMESARVGTQDLVNRTRDFGSSLARWGSGLFGAAGSPSPTAGNAVSEGGTPTQASGTTAVAAVATPSLRAALRARGGICGATSAAVQVAEVVQEPVLKREALPEGEVSLASGVGDAGSSRAEASVAAPGGPRVASNANPEPPPEGDAEGALVE